jgi:nickel-dependent lactate racemase
MADVVGSFAERVLAELDPAALHWVTPSPARESVELLPACRRALAEPLGAPPLAALARAARSIVVLLSDATRDEPRETMLEAIFEVVPRERTTLVVASGTHRASDDVIPAAYRDLPRVVHDGTRADRTTDLGKTSRGTRVRILSEVAEAELVIATGRIRPHYFAGWSGGLKSVFPGCALAEDVLVNHRLKADPSARLGRADDNVCRADMEAAALSVRGRVFLLNVLADVEGNAVAAEAGHPIEAHRALCRRARALFVVRAPRSPLVIVADRPPVSSSLYQASKLLPPAGAILEPGGTIVMVADCRQGVGPLERVNRGIYELGVRPQLPAGHRIVLVSELPDEVVSSTYAIPGGDVRHLLGGLSRAGRSRAVVLWRSGECVAEPVA